MRRRALLSSAALGFVATTGCLAAARRRASGPIRFGHAVGRVHDASRPFVRGGLGGTERPDDRYAAWLFVDPPPPDARLFTDALGAETRRQWSGELRDEDYGAGFVVLAQIRTPRERATTLRPVPSPCEPAWTGWRRARVPLGLEPLESPRDELADAGEVVATLATYVESAGTPERATVPFLSTTADSCAAANETLTATGWSPP